MRLSAGRVARSAGRTPDTTSAGARPGSDAVVPARGGGRPWPTVIANIRRMAGPGPEPERTGSGPGADREPVCGTDPRPGNHRGRRVAARGTGPGPGAVPDGVSGADGGQRRLLQRDRGAQWGAGRWRGRDGSGGSAVPVPYVPHIPHIPHIPHAMHAMAVVRPEA